jgi:hypothetical protein
MEVFLFMTASVALLAGLVGLVAGRVPGTKRGRKDPYASVRAR